MSRYLHWLVLCAWFALVVCTSAAEPQAVPSPEMLVYVERGELPILLSAPHGGRRGAPGLSERTNEQAQRFVTDRDVNTAELAMALAADIEKRLKLKPYIVVNQLERKYVDVNRAPHHAYESAAAEPYYRAYHEALAGFCEEINNRWHGGLLLDIHGQSTYPDAILRGTKDGATVPLLTTRLGHDALGGPPSIFGRLANSGYQVLPAIGSSDPEVSRYSGGYIVQTYSSQLPGGLDAIQLEFGYDFRVPRTIIPKTATDTGAAVESFYKRFLPKEPMR